MTRSLIRIRALTLAVMLGTAGAALAACNTMEGFGQDVEAAGDTIETEAREAND